jgi:MoaA/NifB/PqqE/SkfB family radical SAM enzyme
LSWSRLALSSSRLALAKARGRKLPFSITFILTHRCNFRCTYCAIPDAAGFEMSTVQFQRAIDELAAAGMARASFSGGEALLRADAIDLIAYAHGLGLTTSLNTNGWLTLPLLDRLAPVLDMLVVSLDGPGERHDGERHPGSFERAMATLDAARRKGLATATITVLTARNTEVIEPVLTLAERHGFWAYFQPAYEDCFAQEAGLAPGLGPALLADLSARLVQHRQLGRPVGASPGYLRRLARAPQFGDCSRCHAGRYFGTVMPDGVLVPCHLVSQRVAPVNGLSHPGGFAGAFHALDAPPTGPGCAISPYQESDLIFGLDPDAVAAALRKLGRELRW